MTYQMLNDKQREMIVNTPTFGIVQALPNGQKLSVQGLGGIVEVALLERDGHINHFPPFEHDGFGIATFDRSEVDQIDELMYKMYYEISVQIFGLTKSTSQKSRTDKDNFELPQMEIKDIESQVAKTWQDGQRVEQELKNQKTRNGIKVP